MTPIGVVGFLLSVASIGIIFGRMTTQKLLVSVLLLLVHVAASLYFYNYSLSASADASAYYFDTYNIGSGPFELGTAFVTQMCHVLKVSFGASYIDCFLLFQAFGFAGQMILLRTFDEIESAIGVPQYRGYWALLFLPSVNFWTSAIGKDAPMFFATALCSWSVLRFRSRFLFFCISMAVMILFRAHIALMAVVALAGMSTFAKSVSLGRKAGFLALGLTGIWLTSGAVESTLGVDPTNPSSIGDYLDQQNTIFAGVSGTTSIGTATFPVRLLSLLFRPFFFDASGAMGIIASIENAAFVMACLYMVAHLRDVMHLIQRVPFVRFVALFATILIFGLTLVYYNVGLGLRERVMVYPMVFALLVSLWSLRRKPQFPQPVQNPGNLMADANPHTPAAEL